MQKGELGGSAVGIVMAVVGAVILLIMVSSVLIPSVTTTDQFTATTRTNEALLNSTGGSLFTNGYTGTNQSTAVEHGTLIDSRTAVIVRNQSVTGTILNATSYFFNYNTGVLQLSSHHTLYNGTSALFVTYVWKDGVWGSSTSTVWNSLPVIIVVLVMLMLVGLLVLSRR